MNVQLSSRSDRWYTPPHIIVMVKEVLGDIILDPASDPEANKIVGARHIFDESDNPLFVDWLFHDSIYLNPPGGKIGNRSKAALFWDKLMVEKRRNSFRHAIFMGFSLEQLQTTQASSLSILDFPICVPRRRIRFVSPEGEKSSPAHSNVIVYIPNIVDRSQKFFDVFQRLGACRL